MNATREEITDVIRESAVQDMLVEVMEYEPKSNATVADEHQISMAAVYAMLESVGANIQRDPAHSSENAHPNEPKADYSPKTAVYNTGGCDQQAQF